LDRVALQESAPAKINLGLRVIGRREDGFHELRSVVQTITLADGLWLAPAAADTFTCAQAGVPLGADNLVRRALTAFRDRLGQSGPPLHLHLDKRIPIGAGLGGGSADAAAALRLLNRYHGQPLAAADLQTLAARLGSDVPFLIQGGTALMAGRGEQLAPLQWAACHPYVVVWPGVPVATAWAYAQVSPGLTTPTPYLNFINSLRGGSVDPQALLGLLENDFQPVVERAYPIVAHVRCLLDRFGALVSSMSGSGSAVYGVFGDRNAASRVQQHLESQGFRSFLCYPQPAV
jgi:4-diphosphocytidyl-2-C-methyl-D-erythritol kinase